MFKTLILKISKVFVLQMGNNLGIKIIMFFKKLFIFIYYFPFRAAFWYLQSLEHFIIQKMHKYLTRRYNWNYYKIF